MIIFMLGRWGNPIISKVIKPTCMRITNIRENGENTLKTVCDFWSCMIMDN